MTISKAALIKLLGDRPIAYHPILARALGGVIEAVFASQLLYWYDKGKLEDNWIWKTQAEWSDETGLTRSNQETARRNLKKLGVLKEKRKGVPGKMHFQLDLDRLADLLTMLDSDIVETPQSEMLEPSNVECQDSANNNDETPQSIPENTPENTKDDNREGAATKPPPSHDPTFLPEQEKQLPVLFPEGAENGDYEQVIKRANWQIRSVDIRRAVALFLEHTRLEIPFDKPARKDWLKHINNHVKTYGLDRLRELYPMIVSDMCENKLPISRPGSLTNPLAALVGEMNRNAGNGSEPQGQPVAPGFLED